MVVLPVVADDNLTIYSLLPFEAEQGWKLDLFILSKPIPEHWHEIHKQLILLLEGELFVSLAGEEILLQSEELVQIEPGAYHALIPRGTTRFLAIEMDLAGVEAPLDPSYFGARIDQVGYGVYELLSGVDTEGKWSAALLEIDDSPRHFHRIEREYFVVLSGVLAIEVDGKSHILAIGESILVVPEQVHKLKSATNNPVRVLCLSFPAFDPADMHLDVLHRDF